MPGKKERRPLMLSLVATGSPDLPRWRIANQYLQYWNGMTWCDKEEDALTYEDNSAAAMEVQRLLLLEYRGIPCRRFVAPVYLDLYIKETITSDQIKDWLGRVARLIIDSPKHGNGPCEGSLGLVRIEWGEMQALKEGMS